MIGLFAKTTGSEGGSIWSENIGGSRNLRCSSPKNHWKESCYLATLIYYSYTYSLSVDGNLKPLPSLITVLAVVSCWLEFMANKTCRLQSIFYLLDFIQRVNRVVSVSYCKDLGVCKSSWTLMISLHFTKLICIS